MGNGTSIGRVRGLGSAHEGAHHWLVQRFTAIGNIVLALFLALSLALLRCAVALENQLAHVPKVQKQHPIPRVRCPS